MTDTDKELDKHAPTARPWKSGSGTSRFRIYGSGEDTRTIADVMPKYSSLTQEQALAHRDHIVKAVNAYDGLMGLAIEMRDCFDDLQDEYAYCSMASYRESESDNNARTGEVQIRYALKFADIISKNYEKIPRPALAKALANVKGGV